MNSTKLQQDILKAAWVENHVEKFSPFKYALWDDHVAVIIGVNDVYTHIVLIPKGEFYLDHTKVFKGKPVNMKRLMEEARYAYPAYDTRIIKEVVPGYPPVRVFKLQDNVSDDEIRINTKNLTYFGKKLEEYTVKGIDKKHPLFIFEEDGDEEKLVGIVLPVNY
jgi:hypothetical protein